MAKSLVTLGYLPVWPGYRHLPDAELDPLFPPHALIRSFVYHKPAFLCYSGEHISVEDIVCSLQEFQYTHVLGFCYTHMGLSQLSETIFPNFVVLKYA